MKKALIAIYSAIVSIVFTASCACTNSIKADYVTITTPYGQMKILLYDDTPIHKQNFLHLASEGLLDSLLFHRVIPEFMIQGGDPNSYRSPRGAELGTGEIGQPLDAEILPHHIHKRGALAAARKPDSVNPDKKSSGSQFYIVQGKVYSSDELDEVEEKRNKNIKNQIFYRIQPFYEDSLKYYQQNGMSQQLMELQLRIMEKTNEMAKEQGLFTISPEDRQVYMTEGGVPHLDGDYTVFGEVVEGFDVIDRIAQVQTDIRNRPQIDIRMIVRIAQ